MTSLSNLRTTNCPKLPVCTTCGSCVLECFFRQFLRSTTFVLCCRKVPQSLQQEEPQSITAILVSAYSCTAYPCLQAALSKRSICFGTTLYRPHGLSLFWKGTICLKDAQNAIFNTFWIVASGDLAIRKVVCRLLVYWDYAR